MQPASVLEAARDAARRGLWTEAHACYRGVDPSLLGPEDLEAFADAAWWTSRLDESIGLRQKAFTGFVAAGTNRRAAHAAWFLCFDHFFRNDMAIASGWLSRVRRQLEDEPECAEHGWLALAEASFAEHRQDLAAAHGFADAMRIVGRRVGDPEVVAMATQTLGRIEITEGRFEAGARLLDEAMASVVAGELSTLFTGWIYCDVIGTCMAMADLGRAAEWSRAAAAWCDAQPSPTPFHGLCRVYRLELESLRGAWTSAEADALRTSAELLPMDPYAAAEAFYAIGEIRRRRGDAPAAEEAFRRAHELGRDPQPGLALLALGRGSAQAAELALRLAVAAEEGHGRQRVRLLAAHVEAAVAAGDLAGARESSRTLDGIALDRGIPLIDATAASARAVLQSAAAETEGALASARQAVARWQELKLPYEEALARVVLAEACRQGGDEEGARMELEVAHAAFERLGARTEAARTAGLLHPPTTLPAGLSAREVEVLRLVARGLTNREVAAALSLSGHTVGRHLQNIFAKLGVATRSAATAFAFEHRLL
ncbi:MAG: LuxR C-terminal-related transcriptional regulator [Actinomycetota bacterium]